MRIEDVGVLDRRRPGTRSGLVGFMLLLLCWVDFYVSKNGTAPDTIATKLWILTWIAAPSALLLGNRAARMVSNWWYILSGAAIVTIGWILVLMGSMDV